MIGCILFTLGTLGIHSIYTTGEKARYYSVQRVRAAYLASGTLHKMEAGGYTNIAPVARHVPDDLNEFQVSADVTPLRASQQPSETGRQVSVEVSYLLQGKPEKFILVTQFYK
jgi:hypothetical protein